VARVIGPQAQAECVKAIDADQTTITDGVITEGVLN